MVRQARLLVEVRRKTDGLVDHLLDLAVLGGVGLLNVAMDLDR